jgi:hypothetical protein
MRLNLPVARLGAAHLFHVRKRRCPIDVRLAPAQSIEVRPIKNVDRFAHALVSFLRKNLSPYC